MHVILGAREDQKPRLARNLLEGFLQAFSLFPDDLKVLDVFLLLTPNGARCFNAPR